MEVRVEVDRDFIHSFLFFDFFIPRRSGIEFMEFLGSLTSCSQPVNLICSSKGDLAEVREENWVKMSGFPPPPLSLQEKASLTNDEFEEIVQIVLQKSLQECLGMAYNERKRVSVRERNCYLKGRAS